LLAPPAALAPLWHTRALVLLLLTGAALGSALAPQAAVATDHASRLAGCYLPLLVMNVSFLLYVSRFGLARSIFGDLLGTRRDLTVGALGNLAWGAALVIGVLAAENLLQSLIGFPDSAAAHALVPSSGIEKLCWLGLAAVVGLSEELVYRGYLQRQLAALTGRLGLGIALQALLFGIAHGQQGAWAVARFAVYALAFGWVAARRRTLLPCVLAHIALDLCAGLGV